jgi:hypothetical protein
VIKKMLCVFAIFWSTTSFSSVDCGGNDGKCALQLTPAGALIEGATGKVLVQGIGNQGMLADVSLLKFNGQYVLVRESSTNDKSTLIVPLKMLNNSWVYDSAYEFSVSLINSSDDVGMRWSGVKAKIANHIIDSGVWDRAYAETGKIAAKNERLSKWPSPWIDISISEANHKRESERCFVPLASKDSLLPVDSIACGASGSELADGNYNFSGVVGARAYIDMNLNVKNNHINGRYFYIKERKDISIDGHVDGNGRVQIKEYGGPDGGLTGVFNGSVGKVGITGTWTSAMKARNLPFILVPQGFPD